VLLQCKTLAENVLPISASYRRGGRRDPLALIAWDKQEIHGGTKAETVTAGWGSGFVEKMVRAAGFEPATPTV
jgi:hypothetical protein